MPNTGKKRIAYSVERLAYRRNKPFLSAIRYPLSAKQNSENVIFIDRDGVLNHDPIGDYIKRWEDFRFLPGVIRSLKKLSDRDFRIILISNQAGVGDGEYSESALKEITRNMLHKLESNKIRIHSIFYCLHGKKAGCACRKPKTLLFRNASRGLNYSKRTTFYVGDKATDIEAGRRFGLKTILCLTGHGSKDRHLLKNGSHPDHIVPSFKEAVDLVVGK